MHIPDGFLSTPVWVALDLISLPAVGLAARRARNSSPVSNAPLLGVLGAFVFAAQMINFPVAPGTSAHLLGGALLGATVGPRAGVVVMTAVLVVQALIFQDGGLLALGANVFNLAVVGVLAGWFPYALFGARQRTLALMLGGILSVLASGLLALLQLALSGVPIPTPVLTLSLGFFAVSALLEGVVTSLVVNGLEVMNPDWISAPPERGSALKFLALAAVVLAVAGFLFASTDPDSLESLATKLGIEGRAVALTPDYLADYRIAGVASETIARVGAGLAGLALVFAACLAAARLMRRSA